ncbi:hypothetical protein OBBRIDRAFT_235366 [Obba rivulosa]|uniref:Uncharacterized protein n=1 Tax=Obba rivulosa TaxID=1052685 RepID=A0A8E2J708_9APHY|nr:hypothetical protein OBBRIDRAFT_235366 [Obba rivulosa]
MNPSSREHAGPNGAASLYMGRRHGAPGCLVCLNVEDLGPCHIRGRVCVSHALTAPNLPLPAKPNITMCYHVVECVEYRCGHRYPVDCNGARCRLSSFHTPIQHDCGGKCEDVIRPDVQLVLPSNRQQEPCALCRGPNPKNGAGGVAGAAVTYL